MHTPLSPPEQVHVLSDAASNEVNVDDDVSSGDEADFEDEEDLSDTDNEEEWEIYTRTCLSVAGVLVSVSCERVVSIVSGHE